MLADFYIPMFSKEDRHSEKSLRGSNFGQKGQTSKKSRCLVHLPIRKQIIYIF